MAPRLSSPPGNTARSSIPLSAFLVGLLCGMCAVAITGFFGYRDSECPADQALANCLGYDPANPGDLVVIQALDRLFSRPWVLFLFFSVLLAVLYWWGLRYESRGRRFAALLSTVISAGIAVWFYLRGLPTVDPSTLQKFLAAIANLFKEPGTYVIANLLVILVLAGSAGLRWFVDRPDLRLNTSATGGEQDTANGQKLSELIAGDLIVRGGILLFLAFCFLFNLQRILPGAPQDLSDTRQFQLDLGLGLGSLIVGGFLLWGLLLGTSVEESQDAEAGQVIRQGEQVRTSQRTIGDSALEVLLTLLAVLLSPFDRFLPFEGLAKGTVSHQIVEGSRTSLLLPFAFILNFVAVVGLGLVTIATRSLLHADKKPWLQFAPQGDLGAALASGGVWIALALFGVLLSGFCVAFSLPMFAARRLEVGNVRSPQSSVGGGLLPLRDLGVTTLITFWIPSLVLLGLNELVLLIAGYRDPTYKGDILFRLQPFTPGPATVISLLAFVVFAMWSLVNPRTRKRLFSLRVRER
jgi:hypothetical protein